MTGYKIFKIIFLDILKAWKLWSRSLKLASTLANIALEWKKTGLFNSSGKPDYFDYRIWCSGLQILILISFETLSSWKLLSMFFILLLSLQCKVLLSSQPLSPLLTLLFSKLFSQKKSSKINRSRYKFKNCKVINF